MPTYPNYIEGWNVETTHPIEETEEGPLCEICLNGIQPAVNFAADWGSTDFGAQTTDAEGNSHMIVVRMIQP